jgi:hypothetical protein
MSDEVSGKDRLALRLYLLGMVPPEVGDEIEDRFAEDEAYFTAYKQVERELVVEFAAGRMTESDAACFERRYLTSATHRQEVIVVRALLSVQAEPAIPCRLAFSQPNVGFRVLPVCLGRCDGDILEAPASGWHDASSGIAASSAVEASGKRPNSVSGSGDISPSPRKTSSGAFIGTP